MNKSSRQCIHQCIQVKGLRFEEVCLLTSRRQFESGFLYTYRISTYSLS